MKHIVESLLIGIVILMLTGCSVFYDSVPKNTVMVKKIGAKEEFKLKEDGLLSEETIKKLALNAISKYYAHHLNIENVKLELISMDYSRLKDLLASTIRYLNVDQETMDSYLLQLNNASQGLYFVNVTNLFNEFDAYTITINPLDGEILRVAKQKDSVTNKKIYSSERESTESVTNDEIKQLAKQYIEQNELENDPIDLSKIEIRNYGIHRKLYYRSEDAQVLWHITINPQTKEVLDFSKGIMAVIETTVPIEERNGR